MILLRRHRRSPQSLAWLLAVLLLLPLAQTVAAWHALTHLDAASAADGSHAKHTTADLKCDLCATAVALGSGALPTATSILAEPSDDRRQLADLTVARIADRTSHYLSRAPPTAFA